MFCRWLATRYPKIEIGGVLFGDDYNLPKVAKAVDEFLSKIGKEVKFRYGRRDYPIWVVEK